MNKKYIVIGITCGFIIITGFCYCLTADIPGSDHTVTSLTSEVQQEEDDGSHMMSVEKADEMITVMPSDTENVKIIYVHLCGAVANPGVYELKQGSRLYDLILLSGGLTKDAAGDYINQAQQITDGERIYIPTIKEMESLSTEEIIEGNQSTKASEENSSKRININSASAEELMTLPGIGQSKADSIISYRTTNGDFKSIEELMKITGIKEGVYNKIASYITVD